MSNTKTEKSYAHCDMRYAKSYMLRAFTLLELLLVIAVIAVLAGVVLLNLNPAGRLEKANNTKAIAKSNDIRKAIEAYTLANGMLPTSITSLGSAGINDICKQGQNTSCVNLDILITGGYLSEIPIIESIDTTNTSGYKLEYTPSKNSVVISSGSQTVNQDIVDGLVAWWKMNEASWTNNCSTYSVIDSSGLANNLRSCPNASGPIGGATGKSGNGGLFDGSNDYLYIPTLSNMPTSTMTLCAWIKTSVATDQYIFQASRSGLNINNEVIFQITSDGKLLLWDYSSGYGFDASVKSTGTVSNGNWHHVCFTKNGTSGIYYIDGSASGTKTATQNVSYGANDIAIGSDYRDSTRYFNGSIDDFRIYNRALTPTEITTLYNQ